MHSDCATLIVCTGEKTQAESSHCIGCIGWSCCHIRFPFHCTICIFHSLTTLIALTHTARHDVKQRVVGADIAFYESAERLLARSHFFPTHQSYERKQLKSLKAKFDDQIGLVPNNFFAMQLIRTKCDQFALPLWD